MASGWTWQVNMDKVEKFPFLAFHICTTTSPLFHIFEERPRRLAKPGQNTPELTRRRIITINLLKSQQFHNGERVSLLSAENIFEMPTWDVPRFSRFFSPRVWK